MKLETKTKTVIGNAEVLLVKSYETFSIYRDSYGL